MKTESSRSSILRVLVVALTAALLAACGGDGGGGGSEPVDDQAAVRQVVEEYLNALADGEYEEACGYLSDAALEQLAQFPQYTGSCEDSLSATFGVLPEEQLEGLRNPGITSVEVSGDTATVQTAAQPVPLTRTDDGWKIASLGPAS